MNKKNDKKEELLWFILNEFGVKETIEPIDKACEEILFKASDIRRKDKGFNFKLNFGGSILPIRLPWAETGDDIEVALDVLKVCLRYGFNIFEAARAIEEFFPKKATKNLTIYF